MASGVDKRRLLRYFSPVMPFFELKASLAARVAKALGGAVTEDQVLGAFSQPPSIEMGHLALPCFELAKKSGQPSHELAKSLAASLTEEGELSAVAAGPYVNFRFDLGKLYAVTLARIAKEKARYGADDAGRGKRVVLEYCSPNIAKRLAFQHIRSTLIGNVLANVYRFVGFHVERINFVGDWGAQFARLLAAFELWGERSLLDSKDSAVAMDHLFQLYVRFHKEADHRPELLEKASACLQRLERNEPASLELWTKIRTVSIGVMERTLARMSVQFDHVEGESHYVPQIEATLDEVKRKAGAVLSEGAYIVELPDVKTPALIQKSDGTTLYLTRDLAAAVDRFERFEFDRMLYVVSNQQKLHFQQLFGVLAKMGHEWASRCRHLAFGTVRFGSGKMSTREGNVIFLDDILDEAKKLALKECTEKNPQLADKEEVAEKVGIGAIIFGELSAHKQRDIEFNWKHILAFDGETGPYVQYSLVRCYSLLDKAAEKGLLGAAPAGFEVDGSRLTQDEEAVLLSLSRFNSVLRQAVDDDEPFHLTRYLIELAKAFNRFYYRLPVLQATDEEQRRARLHLVDAVRQVLENGFGLLGIQCPREM